MGKLSLRDRAILLAIVVLALYGLAAILWFMKFERDWTKSAKAYESAVKTYRKEAGLIAKRDDLQRQYEEEEEKIPVLAENELANATWMGRLGSIASENNVAVSRQNYGKEEQEGVLNKLEIDLEWTASLQSLVDKLSASGVKFSDAQIVQIKDAIVKAYGAMAGAANGVAPGSAAKTNNAMFNLYALLALMIDVAQSQRDAQREIRTAENLNVQKAIQDQADSQRDAANLGMWLGIGCGVASAAASIGVMIAQGATASQQAKIVSQSGADSAKMHVSMLQNTDSPENAAAQLNSTTQKLGNNVADRVKQDFNTKLSGDGNNGDLRTALQRADTRVNDAQTNLDAKTAELQTARANLDQKTQALNSAQAASGEKQAYIRSEMSAGREADPARLAEFDARTASVDQARADVTTAQNDVQIKQGAVNLANEELANAKTAQTQARSDYQKTVSEVASSYQDKYQNAVDRLNNPPEGADKAQLQADVDTAKADMEMAFAVEADLLSKNGVMTPTEQTNLVSAARAKADFATDSAYRRMDVKALDTRMTKLMTIGNVNQAMGGVLQSMAQNLSAMRSADATREGAESTKYEEMLDQTKDLFAKAQSLIDQVISLYQSVIQMENQSMRDAIQA